MPGFHLPQPLPIETDGTVIPIRVESGNLPLNFRFTPSEYQGIFTRRSKAYISSDDGVITGSGSMSEPSHNIGPWMNNNYGAWWTWDDNIGRYTPAQIGFIGVDANGNKVGTILNANPTANREIELPDADVTVATIADIAISRDTVTLTGTSIAIDASVSDNFYLELEGDTTITAITGIPAGNLIKIGIVNRGTGFTVGWPGGVHFPTGSHTQPTATAGQVALGVYYVYYIDGNLYCEPNVSGFSADPMEPSTIPSPPDVFYYGGGSVPPPKGRQPYNIP